MRMEEALPVLIFDGEGDRDGPVGEALPGAGESGGAGDRSSSLGTDEADEQLMLAFAQGRTAAFGVLFARYRQAVFGFFRRRVGEAALAEELAQETFLAVLRAAGRYEQTALFRTWLYAIAFGILRAHRRKAAFRAMFLGAPGETREPEAAGSMDVQVMMRLAVGKLDELDREVLLLREFEQLSYAETAGLLKVPLNTVRSRLFRARMALHGLLAGGSAGGGLKAGSGGREGL
jgi:RNA polymerase sigma-70 factor, ECF subfamily